MRRAQVTMTTTVTFDPDRTNPKDLAYELSLLISAITRGNLRAAHGHVDASALETGAEVRLIEET